ncbi:hypothetical protein ABFS83_14G147700 [Erythranthe nasuta]
MSHCFPAGWDINDSSTPPLPPSLPPILAPGVPSGWEEPRAAGTLESVVNQAITASHPRLRKSGDGGNHHHHKPAAVIATNYNSTIGSYINSQEKSKHVPEFTPERPHSGAAAASTNHGGAGVCTCKTNSDGKSLNSTGKSRAAAMHNQSEKKRRERINQRMQILQKLIPNCNKIDKVSILDDVIEYIKQLQSQVEMMCLMNMPSLVMLPLGIHPHHLQISTIDSGVGMGSGMDTGRVATMPPSPAAAAAFMPASSDVQHSTF